MLSEGIIKMWESTWWAQVLITFSENHKKKQVIDFSQTINKFTLLDIYPLLYIDENICKIAKY